ncbi:MAG: HalOD1 output domain-containing protein [Halodesulfurarchaeum sp.]
MSLVREDRQSVVVSIIEAIAEEAGVPVDEVDLTLQDYIEVHAIESLRAKDDSEWSLTFVADTYSVEVDNEGSVSVETIE